MAVDVIQQVRSSGNTGLLSTPFIASGLIAGGFSWTSTNFFGAAEASLNWVYPQTSGSKSHYLMADGFNFEGKIPDGSTFSGIDFVVSRSGQVDRVDDDQVYLVINSVIQSGYTSKPYPLAWASGAATYGSYNDSWGQSSLSPTNKYGIAISAVGKSGVRGYIQDITSRAHYIYPTHQGSTCVYVNKFGGQKVLSPVYNKLPDISGVYHKFNNRFLASSGTWS